MRVKLALTGEDLRRLHRYGIVSQYRRYEAWHKDFCGKLPSYREGGSGTEQGGELEFEYSVNREGRIRYDDGVQKNNPYIPRILPRIFYMDAQRDLGRLQEDLLMLQEDDMLKQMRSGCCLFDLAKACTHCFDCIGLIGRKRSEELTAFEAAKLLEYKLYQKNLDDFSRRLNENFRRNGGRDEIEYSWTWTLRRRCTSRRGSGRRVPVRGEHGEGDAEHLYAVASGNLRRRGG